jgi:LysR family transcriptional activator of nhaA
MAWLNYHHLYYFWVVAREGSIARATKILHLAQPTISGQLRQLEESLGEKLLARRGRGLVLTEVGQTVYHFAEEIFSLGKELQDTVHGRPTGRPMRFAVGIADSLPKLTTYRLLEPAFHQRAQLRMIFRIDKAERLLAELATHSLDLVLTDGLAPASVRIRAFHHLLGECPITVFGSPILARKYRRNFPGSLHEAPFLLQVENTPGRRALDQWFFEHSLQPRIIAEVEDIALLQVLGQNSLGLFAAPSVVERQICKSYAVQIVGRIETVRARFYAISVERKLKHPAVVAVSEAARTELFAS